MSNFGLGKLKITRDKFGNYWIAEFTEENPDVSAKTRPERNAFRVLGEMVRSLDNLHFFDMELKRDIYIAFIGCLGRWANSWRDPLLDIVIQSRNPEKSAADVSDESNDLCIGNIRVLETMQDALFLLDNDTFRKALGSEYESLSEKDIEELKHLLYKLTSAVIEAHSIDCATQNDE